jgi:hypothetical protein
LEFLPGHVIAQIASYLDPDCVVHALIPACPGLAAKLRNQVPWTRLTPSGRLVYVMSVALASVGSVSTMAVPCVPTRSTVRGKWQRLLASDKLKRLRIGNFCYLANAKVL